MKREMKTNLELQSLFNYEARLMLMRSARGIDDKTRKGIDNVIAEVQQKINWILNEGNWRI